MNLLKMNIENLKNNIQKSLGTVTPRVDNKWVEY